jgi:hypothetical protein
LKLAVAGFGWDDPLDGLSAISISLVPFGHLTKGRDGAEVPG